MAESLHSTCLIVSCRTVSLSALRDRFQARGDSLMLAHWKLQSKCPVLGFAVGQPSRQIAADMATLLINIPQVYYSTQTLIFETHTK